MHKHNHYEIMLYLHGTGYLKTTKEDYPFAPGSIIIVPPGIEHGSISDNGFKNISIGGEFEQLLYFHEPILLHDNARKEGALLAALIYDNRYKSKDYLSKLCSAYLHYLLLDLKIEDNMSAAVNKIICEITENFCDKNINLNAFLKKSGYAEDYIRAHFKKTTGKTPNAFLTDIRIKHACFLIDIYMHTLSLQQIAEQCGYTDYVYFSKKFKSIMGVSPQKYKNNILNL